MIVRQIAYVKRGGYSSGELILAGCYREDGSKVELS